MIFRHIQAFLITYRQREQDVCLFDVDTPEAIYLLQPTPIPLGVDYMVGDEVCTIGYPFIGYEGTMTAGKRDMRIVERLTCAHLSAIWPHRGTLTLEFDNYVGPGNSGGPLINIRTGAAIGVVTWSRIERQHHSVTSFSHATSVLELGQLVDLNSDQYIR
jgi:S1-C subfamily serine protease